jgi:saccharopine dehydrogenase-like NADP-dependent oxidoreductase
MKRIFLLGAGRSSAHLIRYILDLCPGEDWHLYIGDVNREDILRKTGGSAYSTPIELNAGDRELRRSEIEKADLVISMLPASMHLDVVKDCLEFGRNVITPSYVPDEMWSLNSEATKKGVLVLNEMGVDPGIDHMSAMRIIDSIRREGGEIGHFESYTGGLVAPASDTNPWHYKVTWNPRNVVLAGYGGTARFRQDGDDKFIPYSHLFERITTVEVPPYGRFEGYANRDSLKYAEVYGLSNIRTMLRGTLRKAGFCSAWNALIQIGLTDDSFEIPDPAKKTWRDLTASFTGSSKNDSLEYGLQSAFGWSADILDRLIWLGIFEEEPIRIEKGSPAFALQKLIEEKWKLGPEDKDLIAMWHRFRFVQDGKHFELLSWLTSEGEDAVYTAMSRTVGLPIGIAARHLLQGKWSLAGIHLPVLEEIYNPVLDELESMGVKFQESRSLFPLE